MERIGCSNVTCCRSATCSIDFSWVIDWEGMNGRNYRVTCRLECVHHPRRVKRDLGRRQRDRAGPFTSLKQATLMNVAHVTRAILSSAHPPPLLFTEISTRGIPCFPSFIFPIEIRYWEINLSDDSPSIEIAHRLSSPNERFYLRWINFARVNYVTLIRIGG